MLLSGLLLSLALLANALYIPLKAHLAQLLLHRAWAETQAGSPTKPWPWADTHPVGKLTVGGESHIVLLGSHGEAMAFAPGLMEGIEQPIISAHRDTHFRALEEAEIGDTLTWQTASATRTYRIAAMEVVATPRASVPEGALVLTTCWPFDALTRGPERLVVTAFPVVGEVGVEEGEEGGPVLLHDAVRAGPLPDRDVG